MRTRTAAAFTLMSLLFAASVALALPLKPVEIGFGGGGTVPVGDAKDAFKTGWHGTAILKLNLPTMPMGLRGAFSYDHFSLDQANVGFPGSGRILSGLANAEFNLPIPGPVKPYVLAGVGTYNIKATSDQSGATASKSQTKFGINGGAGVRISLPGTPIHAFLEGTIENIYTDQGPNAAVVKDFKTQIIPVTFGIFLW